ncbi:MAG TPA: hypothetical protein VK498_04585 [Ferruginibacter sp.]|nr:hypothetical protein [Ferruginibacter sp.]
MSNDNIRSEIIKVLDQLSDKTLEDVLTILKNMKGSKAISVLDKATLEKILFEDKNLLEKLAK